MAEAETGTKLSLAEAGVPTGNADLEDAASRHENPLGRRRSLAEAAWDGEWRPDLDVPVHADEDSPRYLATSDPWDSTSPAMRRDWTDSRPEDRQQARRLRSASPGANPFEDDREQQYSHLPLRSASELSAAQKAAAASVAAAAGSGPQQSSRQLYGAPLYAVDSTRSVDLTLPPGSHADPSEPSAR